MCLGYHCFSYGDIFAHRLLPRLFFTGSLLFHLKFIFIIIIISAVLIMVLRSLLLLFILIVLTAFTLLVLIGSF